MHICTSTATSPPPITPPPSSSPYSHIRKTHKQAHKEADARTDLRSCPRRRASSLTGSPQICVWKHNTHTRAGSDAHVLTGDLLPLVLCLLSPPPVSRVHISILDVKNKRGNQTLTGFCRLGPGHMPSQAPHTSLIMQMRGNVTPRQQMARDDNNGSTDQFQCLRLYRYGNNKNRWYEILVPLIWFCPLSNVCTCQSVSFLLDHLNVKALSDVGRRRLSCHEKSGYQ